MFFWFILLIIFFFFISIVKVLSRIWIFFYFFSWLFKILIDRLFIIIILLSTNICLELISVHASSQFFRHFIYLARILLFFTNTLLQDINQTWIWSIILRKLHMKTKFLHYKTRFRFHSLCKVYKILINYECFFCLIKTKLWKSF